MKSVKRFVLAFMGALALVLPAINCAPASPTPVVPPSPTLRTAAPTATPKPVAQEPRRGGIITISTPTDPPSFDTQQEPTINTSMLVAPAYNTLLEYDSLTGKELQPGLAERWEMSQDGLVYTLQLRKGVKFHDGRPLTEEDIVFNLKRLKEPPKGIASNVAFLLKAVERIEAIGEGRVRLTLKEPFASLPATLAYDPAAIYPKHVVEEKGDMKTTVLGTGPFKYKGYTPGSSFELVKNQDYWVKGRPYLDGATFLILKDKATRLAAVRTGRVKRSGRYFGFTPSEAETLQRSVPGIQLYACPSTVGPWLFLNLRKPPLSDVRVRQAMSLALDRQAAVKVLAEAQGMIGRVFPFEGWGIPEESLLKMPGFRQPKDEDILQAKKLLAAAGYPQGFKLTILSRTVAVTKDAATFMTNQLGNIGIQAQVEVLEDAIFWDRGRRGQHEAMVYGAGIAIPDPHWMGRNLEPKTGPLNFSGNDNDVKFIEMWGRQAKTTDVKERQRLIREIETYLLTEALPGIPIVWMFQYIAAWPEVRNFAAGITDYGNNNLQEVWLAQP